MTEDQEFAESKKELKKKRKLASKKDRSKFKKTDLHKRKKQLERAHTRRIGNKELVRGRVLAIKGSEILVEHEEKFFFCALKGSLKQELLHEKNLVTVGDFVLFAQIDETQGTIFQIEERRSVLSRREHLRRRHKQLIAANIDQLLITVSVALPTLKPSLIDRYIIAAYKGNMSAVLVINKIDLLQDHEEQREFFEQVCDTYRQLGLAVLCVSAATGEGLELLKKQMQNKASVFSGQSGVGKSSLINSVAKLVLPVGTIVAKTQKGTHTTTHASLLPLEFGGFCIDTPGIRSFGVWDLQKEDLDAYFPEIYDTSTHCKFADCTHQHEPGCALQDALTSGSISPLRLHSYLKLLSELAS